MKLESLLEVFDGNTAITINQDDETIFYEQSLDEITAEGDYSDIKNLEVQSFGSETSETEDDTPVRYIDL